MSQAIDPNVVYLVLLFGLWSGVTAAYQPGTHIAEGSSLLFTIGAVLALTTLPTNWAAVLVLIVGVGAFLVVPFIDPRYVRFVYLGLVLQAIGSFFLFNGLSVALPIIAITIGLSLVYQQFVLLPVLSKKNLPVYPDNDERLIGARGRVVRRIDPLGTVQAAGEMWSARSDVPLESGDEVIVLERDGLTLIVEGVKHKNEERQTT
jgi:membrane-bound serine protease (ClpP class)